MRFFIFVLLLATLLPVLSAEEPIIIVGANALFSGLVEADRPAMKFPYAGIKMDAGESRLITGISVSGSIQDAQYEAIARLRATYINQSQNPELAVDTFFAGLTFNNLSLRAGLFENHPGTSWFFSDVEFFNSSNPVSLLESGGEDIGRSDDLVQIRLLGDQWYLSATWSPARLPDQLVAVDSPWFPRASIKDSFDVMGTIYALRDMAWSLPVLPWSLEPSYSVDAGITLGPVDLALFWFDGADRNYVSTANITFPLSAVDKYDIAFASTHSHIQKIGLSLSFQAETLHFYADGTWTGNKLVGTDDLYGSSSGWKTGTRPTEVINAMAGMVWTTPLPNFTLIIEGCYDWYPGWKSGDHAPFLHQALLATINGSFFEGKLSYSLIGLVSTADWSWCIAPCLSWRFLDEHTLSLRVPLFFGVKNAELGQYGLSPRAILSMDLQV